MAYSTSRANLRRGIKKAKHCYKLKVEEHFSTCTSDPRRMWQGIQVISNYKPSNSIPVTTDVSFLNELNDFYARFDRDNRETATQTRLSADHQPLSLSSTDVYTALSQINARKAAGPDGIPGRALRACAEQLTGIFTDIFNLSLTQATVPTCFKSTSIVPVPKHSSPTCLNDYRPVALTPIVMKCFERLVLAHLKNCLPPTLDPHQFAYRSNRCTEDAVSMALHSVLTHLDNSNTYARMLFVDFSSAFNTVIPSKLVTKLGDLGINTFLCHWIMDFLTDRPQHVRSGHTYSITISLNTGVPQGCVLSPFLYSLFTHDCRPVHGSNSIIKFADDTTVIGLISNNDETAYREEVQHLATWCEDNNLLFNNNKTKELIVDFRREGGGMHDPIHIDGIAVERVSSFKFLGTHISEDLSWTTNTSSLAKKAHQRLFFLRTLRKHHLSSAILVNFYHCAIGSILTSSITVWYGNCTVANRKALQRVVKTAQRITGTPLPSIEDVQRKRCLRRARNILKDSSHPVVGEYGIAHFSDGKDSEGENYCIYYNSAWTRLPKHLDKASRWELYDLTPSVLCSDSEVPDGGFPDRVPMVLRGNCTFYQKIRLAQSNGAKGLLVVTDDWLVPTVRNVTQLEEISIPVAVISHADVLENKEFFGEPRRVALYAPDTPLVDYNMLLVFLMAVGTVAGGGYWAGVREINQRLKPSSQESEGKVNVTSTVIGLWVLACCVLLVLLYQFYDYLVYVIIGLFCITSCVGLYNCLWPLVRRIPCGTCRFPKTKLPEVRKLLLGLFCASVSVTWVVFRNEDRWAWMLQDTLGVAFCLYMLKTFQLPSFKACVLLLGALLVYDIFFVFITPFFTENGESIMVEVGVGPSNSSTNEKLPMVLKVPHLSFSSLVLCGEPFLILGFGDILIPGLLVVYCHRFDVLVQSSHVYYLASTLGYSIGMVVTFVAVLLMNAAQPALLYLVPSSLLFSLVVALCRSEIKLFWTGVATLPTPIAMQPVPQTQSAAETPTANQEPDLPEGPDGCECQAEDPPPDGAAEEERSPSPPPATDEERPPPPPPATVETRAERD
ncbi:signal peptide peptidase-like 2 [Trichomycterus rosablanca]|uniref:signal peptide peptidase-like 2 n=1 Tax=Trichomycterus rosablanca TaxID=2290929 RepID=UPI002F359BAB